MLEKLVAELKAIVAEIKSPFSYIHDKLVESMAAVHAEVEELKARIEALENVAPVPEAPPQPEAKLTPTEVVSYPEPTLFVKHADGTTTEIPKAEPEEAK